jgi:CTP:molybdopterin cytidylyltransferase MocA
MTAAHVGLVTAAGASRRMGSPKALLRLADGTTLAELQVTLLQAAGCDPVWLILGAHADAIQAQLPGLRSLINPDWAQGRLTSIQRGLRASPQADGYLIMSVDAVGMQLRTLQQVLAAAEADAGPVIRPTYEGCPGYLVWISAAVAATIRQSPLPADTPLHDILEPHMVYVPVSDPAILTNLNTPEAWIAWRDQVAPTASKVKSSKCIR